MGVGEEFWRDAGEKALFNGFRGSALGQADFWGDAQQVGIYRHCWLVEDYVQNNVCGFAAYAG